jgi:hypothetical protein
MSDVIADDTIASLETVDCANPSCKCLVSGTEQHCSEVCKRVGTSDICECGHPECGGPIR